MNLNNTIIELWHISRTALATRSHSRYDRMQYVKTELQRTYPHLIKDLSSKKIWVMIETQIN